MISKVLFVLAAIGSLIALAAVGVFLCLNQYSHIAMNNGGIALFLLLVLAQFVLCLLT